MKVNFYVDGFNFYYGMYRNRPQRVPWKWLDLSLLCGPLMPREQLGRIRYFTADVTSPPYDPDRDTRQQTYLRALQTIQGLSIHKGSFLATPKFKPPIHPIPLPTLQKPIAPGALPEVRRALDAITSIQVLNIEEKGSDVAIASFMLLDAVDADCEKSVLISNDSDLATPVAMLRQRFGIDVIVFSPHEKMSVELGRSATRQLPIFLNILEKCQFPNPVIDAAGNAIHRPAKWAREEAAFRARRGH